jgi:hypothetical protein
VCILGAVVASMGMLAASFSTRQASKLLQHLQQIIYKKKPCQIGPILQSFCVFS